MKICRKTERKRGDRGLGGEGGGKENQGRGMELYWKRKKRNSRKRRMRRNIIM